MCRKSFAEFAASAANPFQSIFCRGVYLAENTSQAASVEFVRRRRTNSTRGRLMPVPSGKFTRNSSLIRIIGKVLILSFLNLSFSVKAFHHCAKLIQSDSCIFFVNGVVSAADGQLLEQTQQCVIGIIIKAG